MLKVVAKQGTQQHQLSIPADAKVQALHDALEKATGVFARKMKLVFKGKVLDPARGAADQKVVEGAKLMMLASDGSVATKGQVAAQSTKQQQQAEAAAKVKSAFDLARGIAPQGQIAAQSVKQQQQAEAAAKVKSAFDSARGIAPQASTQTLSHIKSQSTPTVADKICWDQRRSNWQKTGIISLRDLGLDKLPGSVISEGGDMLGSAKLADMSCNRLSSLPASVSMLTALHTLKLSSNQLDDGGMPWDSLAQLTALTNLELEGNRLEQIPDNSLSAFTSLKRLNLKSNMLCLDLKSNTLVAMPQGMGALMLLEGMCVDSNRLKSLPNELGEHSNLVELSATDNCLPRTTVSHGQLSATDNCQPRTTVSHGQLSATDNCQPRTTVSHGQLSATDNCQPRTTGLCVESNRLKSLPDELGECCNLVELSATDNNIDLLMMPTFCLPMRRGLCVDNNRLKTLPDELGECCNLVELSATDNNISLLMMPTFCLPMRRVCVSTTIA
eukprot:gene13499-19358_t